MGWVLRCISLALCISSAEGQIASQNFHIFPLVDTWKSPNFAVCLVLWMLAASGLSFLIS